MLTSTRYYDNKDLSDVTLCGHHSYMGGSRHTTTIHAHKVILAQGSSYFRDHFATSGSDHERLEIVCDDYRVAYAMVAHLYGLHYDFLEEEGIEQPIDPSKPQWQESSDRENSALIELIALAYEFSVKTLVDSSVAKFSTYAEKLWTHDKSGFVDLVREVFSQEDEPQQECRQIVARVVATNFNKDSGEVDLPELVREIPDLAIEALKLLAERAAQ